MPAQEQTVASLHRQLAVIAEQKPGLEPLLRAFGGFQTAVAACRELLPAPDVSGVAPDEALLRQGVPLLEHPGAPELDAQLATVAPALLPALARVFPALEKASQTLGTALEQASAREACAACLVRGTRRRIEELGDEYGLAPEVLGFLLHCLAKPAIEVLAAALAEVMQDIPWTYWLKGRCPICGGAPSLSLLRQGAQEPTEYLKNVSAQRWLCCSHCAHTWRIGRTVCPACGHDEKEDRRYFYVADNNLERAELCQKCGHYLLTMDIRDRINPPDHRLAQLGLIHLDILARQKGYAPLAETPWNRLLAEQAELA